MKGIKIFVALILGIILFTSCDGHTFKYSVDVTYQYEDDTEHQYIMTFNDYYTCAISTTDINVSYTVSPGYVNKLIVVPTIKIYPDDITRTYKPKELMFVPDRKFKVIDIKVNGGKVE